MTYRGYTISSQHRPKAGDWVAKARSADGTEYGPFIGPDKASAEALARSRVDELKAREWRDLDEEPLTEEEIAERQPVTVPARPRKHPLSRFLEEE